MTESSRTSRGLDPLTDEIRAAWREQPASELGPEAFVVLWLLQHEGNVQAERAADAMETAFAEHPQWPTDDLDGLHVRRALAFILSSIGVVDVSGTADLIMAVAIRLRQPPA